MKELIGKTVAVSVSEPAEFSQESFFATIEQTYSSTRIDSAGSYLQEKLFVRAHNPFVYEKLKSEYFIVTPRYAGEGLAKLSREGSLIAGIVRISTMRGESDDPFSMATVHFEEHSWAGIGCLKFDT